MAKSAQKHTLTKLVKLFSVLLINIKYAMSKSKLEYIWLDGYEPTANLRSKIKIVENFSGKLEGCQAWSFDGGSTKQAVAGSTDCLLKTYRYFPRP